jgi:hypothetical protein
MLSYAIRSPGLLAAWHRRDRSATIAYLHRLMRLASPEIVASLRLHARSRGIVGARMTGFPEYGRCSQRLRQKASASYEGRTRRPTVSPAQHVLVYFLSKVDMDHPARGSRREEATRGPPSGHRRVFTGVDFLPCVGCVRGRRSYWIPGSSAAFASKNCSAF